MIAYKLLRRRKDGSVGPLFINKGFTPEVGAKALWYNAECHPTKGFMTRRGWHCTEHPHAPHLSMLLKSGEQRIWVECKVQLVERYKRPESQGGTWLLAQRIQFVRVREDLK